jgi:glycosyltransferase involved in cell wall biosynthesis
LLNVEDMAKKLRISLVCPLFDEEDNVTPLVEAVCRSLQHEEGWELLLVDDGSRDDTWARARECALREPRVRPLRLARNYGQSTATQAGFDHARGDIVVTLDGDLQNDPGDIPMLVAKLDEGYDLVAGYRVDRQDGFLTRTLPSRVANLLIRWLTGVQIRDNGCSLKAYRRDLVHRIGLYSDMHRFIPAMAVGMANARLVEVPVRHHPRRYGSTKYGLSRVWKVLADLLAVIMIRWFRHRPLQMFAIGALGSLSIGLVFIVGGILAPVLSETAVDTIVLPSAAVVFIGLAIYLLMVGLIAEVALHGDRSSFSLSLLPRRVTR